ncbi:MAG: peptidoglycan-binding protein [Kineosporiaceae bacterium]|nr:peptidoglycan-binding protein [Aeromicrobium sp.]
MSLSAIASTVKTTFVNAIEAVDTPTTTGGGEGSQSFTAGSTASGAYMVQGAGAPSTGGSLIKKLLVGTVLGAGVGLGATFLVPGLREVTMFGAAGWAAKGIIAAIGGAIGAVGALAVHFIAKRKALAMESQTPPAQQPTTVAPPAGATLRMGSKGDDVLALQKNLKSMGQYYPKVTGTFDKTTQNAIRRYEIMKGVQPTGLGSPDVIQAIAQDSGLIKKLA